MMSPLSTEQEPQEEASVLCLDLDRNREAPALARAAITGFSADRGFSETTLATLNLLVSEIITNAVNSSRTSSRPAASACTHASSHGISTSASPTKARASHQNHEIRLSSEAATGCIYWRRRHRGGAWTPAAAQRSGLK
jgi:hypothetical protein